MGVVLPNVGRSWTRRISRLIRGNPGVVHEIVYESRDDALTRLEAFIRSFLKERAASILPRILTAFSADMQK